MKVVLTTGRADGDGNAWIAGDVIDVPDKEARALIEAGEAEPVGRKQSDERETR